MQTVTGRWRLWAYDYFDRELERSLELEGEGILAGLEELWRKTLEEGVQDDGRPTFTWFDLQLPEDWARIPRDPFENPELGRIRGWREVEGLIPMVAQTHLARLDSGGAEWVLSAARETGSSGDFLRRLVSD